MPVNGSLSKILNSLTSLVQIQSVTSADLHHSLQAVGSRSHNRAVGQPRPRRPRRQPWQQPLAVVEVLLAQLVVAVVVVAVPPVPVAFSTLPPL